MTSKFELLLVKALDMQSKLKFHSFISFGVVSKPILTFGILSSYFGITKKSLITRSVIDRFYPVNKGLSINT